MKDQRYKAIKSLIESDGIKSFKEIFTIIPVSVVREDMKINYNTLRRRITDGNTMSVENILSLSNLFEVAPETVFKLILNDVSIKAKARRKSP